MKTKKLIIFFPSVNNGGNEKNFFSTANNLYKNKVDVSIITCSKNKVVKDFFNKIGKTIEIKKEKLSLNFWTMSSMMAPYYEMLRYLSNWLIQKGLNKNKAENYITSLFLGLSKNAFQNKYKDLRELVKKSQTPKGLNEQGLKEMSKKGVYKSLINTLNSIHKRLNK